ncbi:MAG: hypothetical protein ACF8PN_06515 [Phycisphaerales bacterium]
MTDEIPSDVRGPAIGSGRLSSKELVNTTDVMVESIVASLDDLRRDDTGRTVIVMDRLVNRTSDPSEEFDIFIARLRAALNQSGAKYQLTFVEDPRTAEGVRNRVLEDPLKDDYETPGLRPYYALTGQVFSMNRARENYYEIFFQLLDLDPEAPIRNEIRWENSTGYRFAR